MKKMVIVFFAVCLMSSVALADWSLGFSFGRNYHPQMIRPTHQRIYFPPAIYRPMVVPQYIPSYTYDPFDCYRLAPVYVRPYYGYTYTQPYRYVPRYEFPRYDFGRSEYRLSFPYSQSRNHFGR